MNKKLLGIAAVALLGVSAAFAATTSTVYFTASGNLTKYEEEAGYGVCTIMNNIKNSDDGVIVGSKKYAGELVTTGNSCSAQLISSTKLTNNNTATKGTYGSAYKGISLSDLTFSLKGDYVMLAVGLIPVTDTSYYFEFENSKSFSYTYENQEYTSCSGYSALDSDTYVTGDNKSKFTYKIGDDPDLLLDPKISSATKQGLSFTYSATTKKAKLELNATSDRSTYLYLYIELNEDVSKDAEFSDLTISLPEFTKVS